VGRSPLVDFQVHYTPPELNRRTEASVLLDARGNPCYFLNPLLSQPDLHLAVMDAAGIDAMVLSCGAGFDQPDIGVCRLINDDIAALVRAHPGRFIGLAHVPALDPVAAAAELKRCRVELDFPGVVIGSELQGRGLDDEALEPFWRACQELGLYVFVHPLPAVINWDRMDADDLGRMVGWEFSLMVATLRVMQSGLLDRFADLRIQFSHFSGGIGRYLGRLRGFAQHDKWGTAGLPRHGRAPARSMDYYLEQRLFYDCAGWAGPDNAAAWGAEWVRFGLAEVAPSQVVFATDYPQAVRAADEVAGYVGAVRALGPAARQMLGDEVATMLIPDLAARVRRPAR
jgi:predicted TIM-barrel fold metal-dependent hydrolase